MANWFTSRLRTSAPHELRRLCVGRHALLVAGGVLTLCASVSAQMIERPPGTLLVQARTPHTSITITQGDRRALWRFKVSGDQTREFELSATTLAPTSAYILSPRLALVVCDEGINSRGSQLLVVDLHTAQAVDHVYLKAVAVSPDARYVLAERWNWRYEEDHVGAVLTLYDLHRAAALNRAPSARKEKFDVGMPVYPEHFRTARIYTLPAGERNDGLQLSRKPIWIDARRAVFVYRQAGRASVVTLTFNDGGEVLDVKEQLFDAASYVVRPKNAAALHIDEMSVVSATDTSVVIQMRIGPGWAVRQEVIQVEVK